MKGIAGGSALVLVVGAVIVLLARLIIRQMRHVKKWRQRAPVGSDAFVRDCGMEPGTPAGTLALIIRSSCAKVIGVPPETVHADDPLSDPIWDSLDLMEIMLLLERAMVVRIPVRTLDATLLKGPEQTCVRDIVAALAEHPPLVVATSRLPYTSVAS